ncbi:MAG: pallilysin-related adhesin, partial [Spirochaetaceae bacterium]|nr:pallilysin-related adhesin [Spirochaetaceae bacterium]
MKKLVQAVFLMFCAIALGVAVYYFLRTRSGAAEASRPVATRQVEVGPAASPEEREALAEREATTNRITALPNEVVLDVNSVNLDQDEGDEQILIVRKTDKPEGRLSLVVADYLPQRRSWVRAWEGETLATKLTTLSLQVRDLIGDHTLSIVATGMDDANAQSLTVFRRIPGPDPNTLSYQRIAGISADSVLVEQLERTEGYQLGQTNGTSWPIVAFRHDAESKNLLDQVKTTYIWDFKRSAYVEAGSERITGAEVERSKAAKILTGRAEDFERFLSGVWYDAATDPASAGARLLLFNKETASITFYSAEAQEGFVWNESHPTSYGLYIGCQNESVTNLRRLLDIELTGAESISVRVFEDLKMKVDAEDRWDGTYRKLQQSIAGKPGAPARREAPVKMEGLFRGADGAELLLEGNRFTLTSGGKTERGGFLAYTIGPDLAVELVALKDNGLVSSRRVYRALFTETRKARTIV